MNLRKNIIFIYYIFTLKIIYILSCSAHCLQCQSEDYCTKCQSPYKLLGTHQHKIYNNITCTTQDLSSGYYRDRDNDVYYPCTNSDYGYKANDNTTCYKLSAFSGGDYFSYSPKHYYKCDDKDHFEVQSMTVEHCSKCKYKQEYSSVVCEECQYNYVFVDNNRSKCYSIYSLNESYYKVNDQNYAHCNIPNCEFCISKDICTKCIENYYMVDYVQSECVEESTINTVEHYLVEELNTYYSCKYSIPNCQKCDGKEKCTECKWGYTILDDDFSKCIEIISLNLTDRRYYTENNGTNYYSCKNNCFRCKYDSSTYTCLSCKKKNVFVDDNTTACTPTEAIKSDNHYYKENGTHYKSCSTSMENCLTCKNKTHCLTCDGDNLGVLYGYFNKCIDIIEDSISNFIYKDTYYYNCKDIEGCKKCLNISYCIEAIDSNYCLLDHKPIHLNKKNDLYYLSEPGDENGNTCKSCSEGVDNCFSCSEENVCYQCANGYTIVNNAFDDCKLIAGYKNNDLFFTNNSGRIYYGCGETGLCSKAIENCEKCAYNSNTQKNNCKKCTTGYIILDDDGSKCLPDSDELISDQIYVGKIIGDQSTTKYYTCSNIIPNCETCINKTYCTSCKDDFIFLGNDQSKCLDKTNYTNGHYFTNNSINYYPCIDNCFECNNGEKCITCDEGYEMNDFETACDPILLDDNDIKKNCIYITKNSEEEGDFESIADGLFNDYYSSFKDNKNILVKYINNTINYTVLIFKNDQCSLYLYEDNIFKINSSEIVNELKKCVDSKDIIQIIIIYKNNTSILFYSNKFGIRINLQNECPAVLSKKYNIVNNYKNKLADDIGEKFAELISDKDIDIFNEKSEIFQTFCTDLQIEGIDIPLNVRNFLLYKGNLSYNSGDFTKGDLYACNVECTLVNNNPKNLSSECECELNYDITNFKSVVDKKEEENNKMERNKTEIDKDYKFLNNSKDSLGMFTCSKYAFTGENIKKNAGFYTVLLSSVTQGVSLVFLVFKLKITSFAKLLILANPPPPKSKNKNENDKDENNKKRIVKRVTDKDYYLTTIDEPKINKLNIYNTSIPSTQKRINSENENENETPNENPKNFENNGEIHHQRLNIFNNNYVAPGKIRLGSKKHGNHQKDNISDDDDLFSAEKNSEMDYYPVIKYIEYDINAYRDIGYSYEQKDIKELRKRYEGVKLIQYNLLNRNEKTKILPLIYKSLLKDNLPHKYGIYYDKRNFCNFYFYLFCLRNQVINLFINSNNNSQNFIPFSVKLIKFLFLLVMMLFFNSLFINQKYIYDKYTFFDEKFNFKNLLITDKINSSEKLKYAINHSFVNGLYAYLIVMVIDLFLTWLFSIRRRIKSLLDDFYEIESGRNTNVSRYNRERRNFEKELLEVSDLKNIYIWITAFNFVFIIIFFIYLVNFCSTYKGVVDDLFISFICTFIIYFLVPIISSAFITGLRFIGLNMKIKFFYDLSRSLMEI